MTDDIVTRLRGHHCFDDAGCDRMAEEAADEIEHLHKLLNNAEIERELWRERCERAEECLDFIYRKKRRWRLW